MKSESKTQIKVSGKVEQNAKSLEFRFDDAYMKWLEENPDDARVYFAEVKKQYDEFAKISHPNLDFRYLSMGMSGDFEEDGVHRCVRPSPPKQ